MSTVKLTSELRHNQKGAGADSSVSVPFLCLTYLILIVTVLVRDLSLGGQSYQYVFVASDLFGNTITSDTATFEMTKSYEELLKNPLPDETFAAKVSKIGETNENDLNTIFE